MLVARPLARARRGSWRGLAAAASPSAGPQRRRRRQPPKKPKERSQLAGTQLVSAYVMASTHRPVELAQLLRERFGPSAVRYMGDGDEATSAMGGDDRANVVHLSAPALGLTWLGASPWFCSLLADRLQLLAGFVRSGAGVREIRCSCLQSAADVRSQSRTACRLCDRENTDRGTPRSRNP